MDNPYYEPGRQQLSHQSDLLFHRFNFFLTGTAFLITAFAIIVVSDRLDSDATDGHLLILAHAVNAVGFYIALIFVIINYFMTKVIAELRRYVLDIEGGEYVGPPLTYIEGRLEDIKERPLVCDFLRELGRLVWSPFGAGERNPAPHTWFIPLLFIIFWGFTWFAVLPWSEIPWVSRGLPWIPRIPIVGIVLPFLYLVILCLKNLKKRFCHRKSQEAASS